jgi:hypothetical protein
MRDPSFKDMGLVYAEFSKYYDGKALKVGIIGRERCEAERRTKICVF